MSRAEGTNLSEEDLFVILSENEQQVWPLFLGREKEPRMISARNSLQPFLNTHFKGLTLYWGDVMPTENETIIGHLVYFPTSALVINPTGAAENPIKLRATMYADPVF